MNKKLLNEIRYDEARGMTKEEIRRKLITYGWDENEVDKILYPKNIFSQPTLIFSFLALLLVVLVISVALLTTTIINRFSPTPLISPTITDTNAEILQKIEDQEVVLHQIIDNDLKSGNIPLSKEVAITFRLVDLLHQQNEVIKITEQIDSLQNQKGYVSEKQRIDLTNQIKSKQEEILLDVNDTTHGGTIQQAWLDSVTTITHTH